MKAEIKEICGFWWWQIGGAWGRAYTRRRDAKRGLLRFLKGMKKGVEVVE